MPSVQWINSWWWAEELPETCRASCQRKSGKIGVSGWFYYKEICYDARSHERKIYWVHLLADISNAQYRLPNSPKFVPHEAVHYNSTSPKPDLILSIHLLQGFHTESPMLFPHACHIPHLYHFIISLDMIRLIIQDEKHTSSSSRLCIFIQLPVTSSILPPNIFLCNLFSKHSAYVLPWTSQTKFHNNTKQHAKLQFCIL